MIYAFDNVTVDTGLLEVRRDGVVVPVQPQVFDLLALLITERDRVVSQDEIFERIWKDRIVSDTALSSRIKDARRAVGDDGKAQRLIRTFQRRGFRFMGDVDEVVNAPAIVAPTAMTDLDAEQIRPLAERTETLVSELLDRPAIAVLPFEDAMGGGGSSYLADGITDEVTAALCAWRCFPVISRNTAFRYRAGDMSAPEIGHATGARYLLTGVLQRGERQVKLTAALIDARNDRQMWTGRIVRPVDEIFTLEEDLAQQVVTMLEPEMHGAEIQRILRKPAEDMTAWDLAMRALWCANRSADAEFAEAENLASAAAERTPDWYLPYAIIAFARFQRAMRSFSAADARTAFADTLAAARRALEIDAGSWLAHALAGVGELWTNLNYERALTHVHRAMQLNPSACQTYHFGGCITGFSGDPAAARRHQQRIFRIDPAYPYTAVIEADLGLWHLVEEDLNDADVHLDRAVQWDPGYGRAYQRQVSLSGLRGDRAASEAAIRRLGEIGIPLDREQLITSYPFREEAHREVFFEGLRRAGVNL